ncbi:DUF427 domain-containing protein [Paenarthrobacter sp. PH39-S1]|uniref:DUF427 domain-containing protein n=1 Tax=Paenarthrobacter sp. PH39-S1 TaxID=3046204 RepID=UPI0024BB5D6B|nr:DUF427 domain-containing protein [Paenarthrobacter sp. PH39-S1]MDJ0355251.1 DUF427 domain-containing protein [Paenarthrobacter sp. PH39-S1]
MSIRLRDAWGGQLGELRHEPVAKRVRARLAGGTVVDSNRAVLVWEPRRVVPTYAVPVEDIAAQLVASAADPVKETGAAVGFAVPDVTDLPVLDPRIPFGVRSIAGQSVEIRVPGSGRSALGFRPSDEDLSGYVILDFAGFDRWLEEDDEIISHPHDPFHRIDIRTSSRHVQVMLGGEVLADTVRPLLLFETMLPVRYYIPRDDVTAALEPSRTTTYCAYKGEAAYWSVRVGGDIVADLIWHYENPLLDAQPVRGHLAFFDEKTDLVIDGTPRPRPITPWS